jgi:mannosyl-oligosaccharide alpha-1,2-mannosidase
MMLGGQLKQYRSMYENFIDVAKKYLIFRPMTVGDRDILLTGSIKIRSTGDSESIPNMEHLACFTGGMLAIAGKIFDRPQDLADGKRLTDGCIWAYKNTPSGIMPETFTAVPCASKLDCLWDEQAWYRAVDPTLTEEAVRQQINLQRLSPGFAMAHDRRYLLRPEAIESVFILWRITGDRYWADSGWDIFKAIQAHTTTDIAHSAIDNVMDPAPRKVDEMESFWLAETLKYFYLLYSDTNLVSLDDYVL